MSKQKAHTTNHGERDLDVKFDQIQFNKRFEDEDVRMVLNKSFDNNNKQIDEIISDLLPHEKPIEEIIINMRELFYVLLNKIIDLENPIPYIQSSPDRIFAFSSLIITCGTLLLLLSNLMTDE